MAQIRFKGFRTGTNIGLVSATVGAETGSAVIPAFQKPAAVVGVPRISDAFDDGTLTPNDGGITVTTRIWRIVDGAVQGNGATLSGAGLGGQWIEYSPDNGTTWSPPVMVYAKSHMGMSMPASHLADDAAIVALVPHAEATHIAVASGDWSDPATWLNGAVPKNGATVLIPRQISVTYDVNERFRLDRVRVDGTLTWALDQSTAMLVETLIGTRGSSILMGTAGNRLPPQYTATVTVSGKDYSSDSLTPTNLKSNNFLDTLGWSRGIISQGIWRIWGAEMTPWGYCEQVPSGATTLTMLKAPSGWTVGDVLIVGGTRLTDYVENNPETAPSLVDGGYVEDEYVTITAISGTDITFAPALVHDHINHNTASTRTDLYPVVAKRGGKNISIRSEVTDINWRRGHTANVHHHCVMDFWDVEFIGLGRTTKGIDHTVGVIDANGDFRKANDGPAPIAEALTNTSNLASRYPVHAHHCGFGRGANTAVVNNCYVEDTPGWAIVHHACEANTDNNVMHLFGGAGMISESGNEIGSWVGNLAIGTTGGTNCAFGSTPKNTGRGRVRQGDFGWEGFGFVFRGRVMRTNRNVAVSCGWGHVYHHRTNDDAGSIGVPIDPQRGHLDFKDLLKPNWVRSSPSDGDHFRDFDFKDAPITHNADNEAIACVGGFFVTKDNPRQSHDKNIHIKDFKAWGYSGIGLSVEYISAYLLEGIDCTSAAVGVGFGISIATNSFQVGVKSARTEGNAIGSALGGGDALFPQIGDNFNNTTDPRYYVIGHTSQGDATDIDYIGFPSGSLSKTGPEVTIVDVDPQDDTYDRFADPDDTFAADIGTVQTGATWSVFNAENTDGAKIDTLSSDSAYPMKPHNDNSFITSAGIVFGSVLLEGYHTLNSEGGARISPFYHWVSDRVSARPKMKTKYAQHSYSPAGYTDLGVFSYTAIPVTLSDNKLENTVAVSGSVVVDVLGDTGPTGGTGSFALTDKAKVAPDHGKATLNPATGEVTYTPDMGYAGTDFMYVFVESDGQFALARLDFLIGSTGSGITAPVAGTHFTVAGGAGQTIDVTLLAPPETDQRRINPVQYSTDGGVTWRRLSPKWVQGVQTIAVQSNGSAIGAGSYTVRLRYKTDYDYLTSSDSGDAAITVV